VINQELARLPAGIATPLLALAMAIRNDELLFERLAPPRPSTRS